MARDTTLHDVAKQVGVSPRTVSRVVNDEGGFSEATRRRVLDAVAELGYRPNLLARGLITRRSDTIGLVGGDMTDPFFPGVAEGTQRCAREAGLTMFFASTNNDIERQREVLNSLWSHAVDGVIIFPSGQSNGELIDYARRGLTMVVVDDEAETPALDDVPNLASIRFDLESGTEMAVAHLADRGRSSIAMLASTTSLPGRRRREQGVIDALARRGLAAPTIVRCDPTMHGGESGTSELLTIAPATDAIIAYNDVVAIGALRSLRAAGRKVPDDIAVVGFDDIEMSGVVTPSLTTVRLDRERLAVQAVEALRALNGAGAAPEPVELAVQLIEREST